MNRRIKSGRVTIRDLKSNADRAIKEARVLIEQSSGAVDNIQREALVVLTSLLETTTETLVKAQEAMDMLTDGVTIQLVIAGKPMPVEIKLLIDD